jgi:hypothetical protein
VSEVQTISLASVVVPAKDQVSSDLAGEAVILDLKNGVYHGLDPTGARIWSLIQERKPVSAVRDAIMAEYEVAAEVCEPDILALLQQLVDKGLAEIVE